MKKIITKNNYIELIDEKEDITLGFNFGELMYILKNKSISFFYQEDYLYDNVLFTSHLNDLTIDGIKYDENNITNALEVIFVGRR